MEEVGSPTKPRLGALCDSQTGTTHPSFQEGTRSCLNSFSDCGAPEERRWKTGKISRNNNMCIGDGKKKSDVQKTGKYTTRKGVGTGNATQMSS